MRKLPILAALALAVALAGCTVVSASAPGTAAAGGAARPYRAPVGFAAPDLKAEQQVSALAGVTPEYVSTYLGPGAPFPAGWAALARKSRATLVLQLDTGKGSLASVADGAEDPWLRALAASARSWNGPLAIGIDHEFNGPWWPWSYNRQPAASFTAAWRHIVGVFRAAGVRAAYVWTISNWNGADLAAYWPGSKYVNWIGLNAYYYSAADTWANTFAPAIAKAQALADLPVLVTETGAAPVAGRTRAIANLFAGIRSDPSVLGAVYFDYDKASANGSDHNWYLDNDPAALAAFRAAVKEYG